ncbi:hypothetical protein LARI1_G006195 [Lachnellula arida]|uniref:Uncharacterized protein n=1 Tax=Lachnellula arida TaxID=1316785 RepID=A0A8T9BDR8_9HELO|nr:hypothetical protein LARI1_G006195 [Lachnellula arida]
MDQGFVKHMSIGLYFRWDTPTQRYIWATKEYPETGLSLPPLRPGLYDERDRNFELSAYFKTDDNVSFDPFMQYILDWGSCYGQQRILDAFCGSGGWEKWVHSEMHLNLQHFVDRYCACWREACVYSNAPKQKADLLLSLEPETLGQPLSVLLELKVELVETDRSRVSEFRQAVTADIRKIQDADLYRVPPGDHPRVGRPCHAYVVALTVTDNGDRAMTQLGMMRLEPLRQRQGEAWPFNVWWFRRVID